MFKTVIFTVIPVPMCSCANVPVAFCVSVKSSPETLPESVAEVYTKVAVVSESYTLFYAVMPDSVIGFAVIFAVVEAVLVKL